MTEYLLAIAIVLVLVIIAAVEARRYKEAGDTLGHILGWMGAQERTNELMQQEYRKLDEAHIHKVEDLERIFGKRTNSGHQMSDSHDLEMQAWAKTAQDENDRAQELEVALDAAQNDANAASNEAADLRMRLAAAERVVEAARVIDGHGPHPDWVRKYNVEAERDWEAHGTVGEWTALAAALDAYTITDLNSSEREGE